MNASFKLFFDFRMLSLRNNFFKLYIVYIPMSSFGGLLNSFLDAKPSPSAPSSSQTSSTSSSSTSSSTSQLSNNQKQLKQEQSQQPQQTQPQTQQQKKEQPPKADGGGVPKFEFDRGFLGWLDEMKTSFMISSYKTHKVISLGIYRPPDKPRDGPKLSIWMTQFNRPMGVHTTPSTVWISSSGNLWRYENAGKYDANDLGIFDASYIPRKAFFSNDVDTHDLCVDNQGQIYYCSALFGCICTPSDTHSFKVYWKPPWVSKVAPEDRTHLNGICCRDGKPRYVTAVCQSDVRGAWREKRIGSGVVYDIVENKMVCDGLSMPHSPRWAHGKLWILEAGTGWFGYVNFETGKFEQKVRIRGYLRGLSFVGNKYAVIGSSEDRHENTFKGLPLGDWLSKQGVSAQCGMFVVDLETWDVPHNLIFFTPMNELYDVCAIPGVIRPRLIESGDEKNMRTYLIDHGDYANK